MIFTAIDRLITYGLNTRLIRAEDTIFIRNRLLELLGLSAYEPSPDEADREASLVEMLEVLSDFAIQKGLCDNGTAAKDRFTAAIMGVFTPRPSEITEEFWRRYNLSPKEAADYFYRLCRDNDYIRTYRTALDLRWKTPTQYGELDITVNLAKPEKDPKDIAAERAAPKVGYPACMLCAENEGYSGRADFPARHNHRMIPVKLCGEDWYFQYSPYVYYNEHCIILNKHHIPMIIDKGTFTKLLDFVSKFPHYFIGSNADLPIVGGSILSHEHFQGGRYEFPMERANAEMKISFAGFEDVSAHTINWPMPVIRIAYNDPEKLAALADKILKAWRSYSDAQADIFAFTNNTPHNTITPIARLREGKFELDLVLRNNRTTIEHPLGLFHPHAELHNIKKENIGLIEVMGLAVLPSRLKAEMDILKKLLLNGADIESDERVSKHTEWITSWRTNYPVFTQDNADEILHVEIGRVFERVLEHAGVFKRDENGQAAFSRFLCTLGIV